MQEKINNGYYTSKITGVSEAKAKYDAAREALGMASDEYNRDSDRLREEFDRDLAADFGWDTSLRITKELISLAWERRGGYIEVYTTALGLNTIYQAAVADIKAAKSL